MVFGSCPFTKSGNSQGLSWIDFFYPQVLLIHLRSASLFVSVRDCWHCFFPGNTTEVVVYPRSLMSIQYHTVTWWFEDVHGVEATTFNALQSRDRWYHCNPPHKLHDDTKYVYTVILQHLGDDARNIIAIWNDWECWQPKWLLKSDPHSKWPPNPQLAEVTWDHSTHFGWDQTLPNVC